MNDRGGYWWPPAFSTWGPTIVSFIFFHNLLFSAFFRVLNFRSRFEALNRDSMPKLHPWEVETPIYPSEAHSFGTSSPRVKFLENRQRFSRGLWGLCSFSQGERDTTHQSTRGDPDL